MPGADAQPVASSFLTIHKRMPGYWRSQSNGRENSCIREAFQNYLDSFGIFRAKVLFHRFRVAVGNGYLVSLGASSGPRP